MESKFPKRISYVLPTKNRAEPHLKNNLNQLRDIVKSEDELIVIDGLSKDGTDQIVKEFDDIINIYISQPDLNIYHACNKGMLISKGRYIKILNDDDIYYKKAMDDSVDVMDINEEIDILICGGTKQRGNNIWDVYIPPGIKWCQTVSDLFNYSSSGQGMLIRHEALAKIGLFDASLQVAGDSEFLARAVFMGAKVKFCRINSYHHPVYDHSTTIANEDLFNKTQVMIKEKYIVENRKKINFILILKQKMLERISHLINCIFKFIYKMIYGRKYLKPSETKTINETIWDGGLS